MKLNAQQDIQSAEGEQQERSQPDSRICEAEEVDSFPYLGGCTADIKKRSRIAMDDTSFRRLVNIWKSTDISRKTKVFLFKSLFLSVLLY